jgi:hypothetical protein
LLAARLCASIFDVAGWVPHPAACRTLRTSDKVVKVVFSRWYYWPHRLAVKPLR